MSNLGDYIGDYLGASALETLGVAAPHFHNLETYIALRSAMRAAPIALVPFLVPRGSPADPAEAIGAGAAITNRGDEDETLGHRAKVDPTGERDGVQLASASVSIERV